MAVEIKYVVIREGEEKMSFASKKEADAYDKMLDLAEVLNDWLVHRRWRWMTSSAIPWRCGWRSVKKRCSISCELADCRSKTPAQDAPRRRLPPRFSGG
jgi:hypothetical protein